MKEYVFLVGILFNRIQFNPLVVTLNPTFRHKRETWTVMDKVKQQPPNLKSGQN